METAEVDSVTVEELKITLREQLDKSGVNALIRNVVREACTTKIGGAKKLNSDDVVQEVYNRGLMKNVLDSFKFSASPKEPITSPVSQTKHIQHKRDAPTRVKSNTSPTLVVDPNPNAANESSSESESSENNPVKSKSVVNETEGRAGTEDNYDEDEFLSDCQTVDKSKHTKSSVKFANVEPSDREEEEDKTADQVDVSELSQEITKNESEAELLKTPWTRGPMMGKYYLKLEMLGGSAFLEHLFEGNTEQSVDYNDNNSRMRLSNNSKLVIHIFLKSERFHSNRVDCRCEPQFQDTFMLDLGYFENASILQLLAMNEPLRFVLVRENGHGESFVVSHMFYDWRPVLMSGTCSHKVALDLMGIGPEHKVPIGILNLRLSILPSLQEQVSNPTHMAQITVEKLRQDEKDRLYLVYTKQWGREFMDIRPENQNRLVKLFSYDENTVSRPVQQFVKVLTADRLLPTPCHAAWFVSMFTVRDDAENMLQMKSSVAPRNSGRGDARHVLSDHWQSVQSTIASKSGSVEDHATLLCGLLLGFGLEAYVAIGTKFGSEPWVWVVTFDMQLMPTFWDSVTGKSCVYHVSPPGELPEERLYRMRQNDLHKLKTIDCLFNNADFFANVQPCNSIEATEWNLNNPSKWKRIPESTIQSKMSINYPLTVYPSTVNPIAISTDLEIQLKTLLSDTRRHKGLHTKWDEKLSSLLGQELARYELEASIGVKPVSGHFETAVMKYIPNGYDFKGFPYHSVVNDPKKIYYDCLRERKCKEIVCCRGLGVNHALRVDTFPYPEGITSIRIMFACKYMSVS